MPLRAQDCRGGCNPREGQALGVGRSFFTTDRLVGDEALCQQEPVGRDAQRGMVMEPPPTSSLIVSQAEVLLQILVVAFDAPALMGYADQLVDRRFLGQRGQDVLARLGVVCRPLDEQPLLGT